MGFEPKHILTTHKHWDHSGGNKKMAEKYPGITIIGGAEDEVGIIVHSIYCFYTYYKICKQILSSFLTLVDLNRLGLNKD